MLVQFPETPPDEEERLAALRRLNLLDTHPEERFDQITRTVRDLFDVPIALLTFVDERRQWFKSRIGLTFTETERSLSFCAHTILGDGLFEVPDATIDVRFASNPLVTGPPGLRFYAGMPLHAPGGERVGTLCVFDHRRRELNDLQRAALAGLARWGESELWAGELQRVAAVLREEDELKDQFFANVSHEMRTPITSLQGALEALLGGDAGELDDEQRMFAEMAHRNAGLLRTLVDDLLLLTRLESGRVSLIRRSVDIRPLVEGLVAELGALAEEKRLILTFSVVDSLLVDGDPMRLHQILLNLATNAIKFSEDGKQVMIEANRAEDEVIVAVTDWGVGIPQDEIAHLTERFFRASTAEGVPGTGLGLAVVHELVGLHGGRLEVVSEIGKGSTFRVYLPAVAVAD